MNRFLKTHPFTMLVYFLAVIGVSMFCNNPVLQLISLLGATAYAVWLSKGRGFLSQLLYFITLFALVAVTNPLFVHNGKTPLFFMNGNPVTLEAIICGASIALMIIATVLWFSCMTRVMTSDKFYFLFAKISPKLALVFSMALNFVPRLKKSYKETEKAHKTLGIYSTESYFERLFLKLKTMSSTVAQSAENSIETSASMNARGYGEKGRTSFETVKFTFYDLVLLCFTVAVTIMEIIFMINGATAFEFYPTVTKITLEVSSVTAYAGYFVLCFLPVIIEITESLRWKYFVSKI
ncbi:MAG: energy-coupling factor transporter transmembrane protein EcfT [Ruminococcus sp.]|nr:energy-coupling factor transporter transmembrane protein EcfT [Ruminococcus sp.]